MNTKIFMLFEIRIGIISWYFEFSMWSANYQRGWWADREIEYCFTNFKYTISLGHNHAESNQKMKNSYVTDDLSKAKIAPRFTCNHSNYCSWTDLKL